MSDPDFNFGYDVDAMEFILWKRGRANPVARVPFADALALSATVAHVAAERAGLGLGRNP